MSAVLVEVKADVLKNTDPEAIAKTLRGSLPSFKFDTGYPAVPMTNREHKVSSYILRGDVAEESLHELKQSEIVLGVFQDTPIAPF